MKAKLVFTVVEALKARCTYLEEEGLFPEEFASCKEALAYFEDITINEVGLSNGEKRQ
jgi:hypothetical protein